MQAIKPSANLKNYYYYYIIMIEVNAPGLYFLCGCCNFPLAFKSCGLYLYIHCNSPNLSLQLCKNHTWTNVIKMDCMPIWSLLWNTIQSEAIMALANILRCHEIHSQNHDSLLQCQKQLAGYIWKTQYWPLLRFEIGPCRLTVVLPATTLWRDGTRSSPGLFDRLFILSLRSS